MLPFFVGGASRRSHRELEEELARLEDILRQKGLSDGERSSNVGEGLIAEAGT